jgi:hypothetical protein
VGERRSQSVIDGSGVEVDEDRAGPIVICVYLSKEDIDPLALIVVGAGIVPIIVNPVFL